MHGNQLKNILKKLLFKKVGADLCIFQLGKNCKLSYFSCLNSFPKNNFKINKSNILDIGRNYQSQNNNYNADYKYDFSAHAPSNL
jgi:hypothetical protein